MRLSASGQSATNHLTLFTELLRSASCRRPLLGILMYAYVHSGSRAGGDDELPLRATVSDQVQSDLLRGQ